MLLVDHVSDSNSDDEDFDDEWSDDDYMNEDLAQPKLSWVVLMKWMEYRAALSYLAC
jgi:hypothetical protein